MLIQHVLRHGHSRTVPPLRARWRVMKAREKNAKQPLLAVIVSTKVSKKAVVRNRLRRQVKAIIWPVVADFSPNIAIVLIVMRGSRLPTFLELRRAIEQLVQQGRWRIPS